MKTDVNLLSSLSLLERSFSFLFVIQPRNVLKSLIPLDEQRNLEVTSNYFKPIQCSDITDVGSSWYDIANNENIVEICMDYPDYNKKIPVIDKINFCLNAFPFCHTWSWASCGRLLVGSFVWRHQISVKRRWRMSLIPKKSGKTVWIQTKCQ